ncbi:hypothetical protein LCGC14_1837940 [marine sediment metagenome]|uniref:Uncharacterized protein n=1 Tax=marine sediment metagenome TaxID=412755 RepID=A0A0F9ITG6_9ZZZZ
MRLPAYCLPALVLPLPAFAHSGHLTDLGGHDHWVAGAAIAIAGGISLWSYLKGKRQREEAEGEGTAEEPDADAAEEGA